MTEQPIRLRSEACEAIDPLQVFAAAGMAPRFYWEQPAAGRFRVGIGSAACLKVAGAQRFREAEVGARELFARIAWDGPGPRIAHLLGGFAFSPTLRPDGAWRGFPDGVLRLRTHDLDHSIAAYRDLLALDPANLRGKMGLARVLRWSHRYADAEGLYKDVLAAAPDDGNAIEGLAQTYALAGDFPGALALLDRGLSLSPEDADLLGLKGTVLAWQGRFDEGRTWAERALALNPRSASIERGLGDILMWKRDYDRGCEGLPEGARARGHVHRHGARPGRGPRSGRQD